MDLPRRVCKAKAVERHTCALGCTCFPHIGEADYEKHADEKCKQCGGARFRSTVISAGGVRLRPVKVRRAVRQARLHPATGANGHGPGLSGWLRQAPQGNAFAQVRCRYHALVGWYSCRPWPQKGRVHAMLPFLRL